MDFRVVIIPLTLVVSIALGSWQNWNILSIYGKDNRKVYSIKIVILFLGAVLFGIGIAAQNVTNFNLELFYAIAGLWTAVLYTSVLRRVGDITHLSTRYKVLLCIVCPVLGSNIRFVDLALNIAIVLLMFIPPKKEKE